MKARRHLGWAALIAASALAAAPSPAPIAGELRTEHFVVRYTAHAQGTARELVQRVESVRTDLEALLGEPWPGRTEIRIGVGRAELEALSPREKPPAWAAAVAYPEQHLVILEARNVLGPGGDITLRHEMCHAALGELGGPWPRWFQEGLAVRSTGEPIDLSRYTALFRAVTQDRIFRFEDLAAGWPDLTPDVEIAYAQSASFVGFLADRHGPARFRELLERVHQGDAFEMAFGKAFHSSLDAEERDWRTTLPARYSWLPILTGEATLWFLAACACVLAYLRRRAGRARWDQAQEAQEALEIEPIPPEEPPLFH